MKRFVSVSLVLLVLLFCLSACSFTQRMAGALADNVESAAMVKEMITALSEDRISDAKALMHPQSAEDTDSAIAQMHTYLSGKTITAMEPNGINIQTSAGTAGKSRQENVSYRITFADGEVIYCSAEYLSDSAGSGFVSFQLILGVV